MWWTFGSRSRLSNYWERRAKGGKGGGGKVDAAGRRISRQKLRRGARIFDDRVDVEDYVEPAARIGSNPVVK